jgi:hypothetical protein
MGSDSRDEHEDATQQLDQLLQEIRVAIPGVQMLFGFLLTVPFNERFHRLGTPQRSLFFVIFLSAAFATIALIAPSSYHRLHKGKDVRQMLSISNKLTIAGLAFLSISIIGSVYLLTEVVFGVMIGRIAAAVVAAAALGAWFVLPLSARLSPGRSDAAARRASSSRPSAAPS